MIKFFRHLRQQLVMENKTSKPALPAGKYLKYAIGEILLVVIGILIALQINSANEQRKNKITEITIYKNLKEDINLDTLDIQFNLKKYKELYIEEKKLLAFLQSDGALLKNALDFSNSLGTPLIISLHKSTFENLQNNNIGILSNNELRKDIARFYDFLHSSVVIIENQYPAYQTYAGKKPFYQKYFKLS